ncbi:hypothetical protein AA0119_g5000 [Alternaria tenuissima]|nr:hypothetical protein AA0115_g1716 [Alternaria tenuissima]RYO03023.1 hypothetical protein AA0119_g5000 [Alternaria tenuissima]RYO25622.1 hypothetical protein AA0121_g1351 [Alternaria tenuissima]RYO56202.1 hypothetical protein AA0116_g8714 [Alternaria tenuissima]
MKSRSGTPSQKPPTRSLLVSAPKPPGQLFRVVKPLSKTASSSIVYLCLPRALPPPFEPSKEIDYDLQDRMADVHDAFQTVRGNTRLRQQLSLLSYKNSGDVLYENMQHNGTSLLHDKHLKMLPQLVVVKMSRDTDLLREEVLQTEAQHKKGGLATLHVGSHVLRAQFTASTATSFVCLRPVFGPTLAQFGEASNKNQGRIPGWFVGHICVALVDAVDFLHDEGIVHAKIEASNIMFNLYPTYMHHRYRGYPDVQLIDFSLAGQSHKNAEDAKEQDHHAVLELMEHVITEWSDVAPFMPFINNVTGLSGEGDDPVLTQLALIRTMLSGVYDENTNLAGLHARAVDIRHEGPENMPWNLMKLLHADLVTADELDRAVRAPLALRLTARREAMAKVIGDIPVTMGGRGHAGMKTSRIIVLRFVRRKMEFVDAIGQSVAESVDEGARFFGNTDASIADVEMSGAEP